MAMRRVATVYRHVGMPFRFASLKSLNTDEISIESSSCGQMWNVLLNRPKGLNALTSGMIRSLYPYYAQWAGYEANADPLPRVVIMEGAGGKAFCAGGDVVVLAGKDLDAPRRFFFEEYLVDYATYAMAKRGVTQVALWNGIVMGGGVGLSVHAPIRVATEKTLFALPETSIGLFPDVGTSAILSTLSHDGLGCYLGLIGARLKGADVVHAGIATHYVSADAVSDVKGALSALAQGTGAFPSDPAAASDAVAAAVATFGAPLPPFSIAAQLPLIAKYFGSGAPKAADGVGVDALAVLHRLEAVAKGADGGAEGEAEVAFAKDAAKKLRAACPASVAVTARLLGVASSFTQRTEAFETDYILSQQIVVRQLFGGNFQEGVRALLIDKSGSPQWQPGTLEEVDPAKVKACFDGRGITKWTPTAGLDATLL